jgi:hypothetical protein
MNKFLGKHNPSKLNQEDMNHQNKPITSNEIEAVIKSLPTKKSPGPDRFMAKFYENFKEELIPILCKRFQEIERERTLPNSFYKPTLHSFQNPKRCKKKKRELQTKYP